MKRYSENFLKREALLRKIIETTKKIPDLKKVKQEIVEEIGKAFNADRCYFRGYDKNKKMFLKPDTEYRSSPKILSVTEVEPYQEGIEYFYDRARNRKSAFIMEDTEKYIEANNLHGSPVEKYLKNLSIKSDYPFPVWDREDNIIYLVLHYVKKPVSLPEEDIELLFALTNQAVTAIDQSQLYENIQKYAERETLLRSTIETISSTFDINEIKNKIVSEISNVLKPDRVFIIEFDTEKERYLPVAPGSEYLSSPELTGFVGVDLSSTPGFEHIQNLHRSGKDVIYSDIDAYIEEYNLKGTKTEKFFKDYDIKSLAAIEIYCGNNFLGNLVIQHSKEKIEFDENYLEFARVLASQAGIALYQAKLYESQKQTLERERILRQLTEKIRSSLDINEIIKFLADLTGSYFDADRCVFQTYKKETGKYLKIETEYLKSPETESFNNFNVEKDFPEFVIRVQKGKNIIIKDVEKICSDKRLSGYKSLKTLHEIGVKSDYALSVKYKGEYYGTLIMHFITEKRVLSAEELDFLKLIRSQAGAAISQSELYENQKNQVKRGNLLREIIQTIRKTFDIDEILTIVCDKVAEIFEVDRAAIIEFPDVNDYRNMSIRREYKKRKDLKGITDIAFNPKTGEYNYKIIVQQGKNLVINDIEKSDTPDYFKNTYKQMGVKSLIGVPVKNNGQKWGLIYLSVYDNYKNWLPEEVTFLEDIASQIYIAIKQAELYGTINLKTQQEELRKTHLATLIHDLKSPLNAVQVALKYILSRDEKNPLKTVWKFLNDIFETNLHLLSIINDILTVYKFESGEIHLEIKPANIEKIVSDVIKTMTPLLTEKESSVNIFIPKDIPKLKIDKIKINRLLTNLISNATIHNAKGIKITISAKKIDEHTVQLSVKDNGKGIPDSEKHKIFERFPSQKRGPSTSTGIGLYLSKQIAEAHGGEIWFDTKIGKGTTFYFTLPC